MHFDWPHPATARAVTDSGWTPARRIDIAPWIDRLEGEGYHVSPPAAAILESFGNLAVRPLEDPHSLWGADSLFFDPIDVGNGMYERYYDFESALGHRMTPLAANSSSTSFLLILDDGRLVSDGVLALHLLGNSLPEALDLLIRRHRTPPTLLSYDLPIPAARRTRVS
ncbi:SUKH-3 domain-containing protein [Nocardia sp. NBC_00511]|uniref:SUKH-3 domain-containing protein n=1 Tax=Nocardia sp. NBC_00511 TaxID=2903591 RepID=UPI0030E1D0AC